MLITWRHTAIDDEYPVDIMYKSPGNPVIKPNNTGFEHRIEEYAYSNAGLVVNELVNTDTGNFSVDVRMSGNIAVIHTSNPLEVSHEAGM